MRTKNFFGKYNIDLGLWNEAAQVFFFQFLKENMCMYGHFIFKNSVQSEAEKLR